MGGVVGLSILSFRYRLADRSPGITGYAPRQYGDAVGDKMQSVMSPVGKPLGKGLETVAGPVGGLVDPLVGGIHRSGAAFGAATGVGAGNMEHKNREEDEEMHRPYGGKEQTGENPLGI